MSISTGIGGQAYVAAAVPETQRDSTAYPSLTWTEVSDVETWADFFPEGSVVPFTPLKDGVTRQLIGAINPGTWTLTCADNPLDAGQIALKAAAGTRRLFPIKLLAADGADSNDTDSAFYFGLRVTSAKPAKGQPGVSMIVFSGAIDTTIHAIPSVAVSGGT